MWVVSVAFAFTAIAWQAAAHPEPTPLGRDFDPNGWTPAPTPAPRLLKRQSSEDLQTCGYVDGLAAEPVTCGTGICGFDVVFGWFGCCSSTSVVAGTVEPAGCPVVTNCVDYEYLDQCSAIDGCASDDAIRKCTNTASPYCAAYTVVGAEYMHNYFCAELPEITGIYLDATDMINSAESTIDGEILPGTLPGTFSLTINTDLTTTSSERESTSATRTSTASELNASTSSTASAASISAAGFAAATGRPVLIEVVGVAVAVVMNLV